MVLRETQRAFVYFSLHGLTVDGVIVNRVLPARSHRRLFPGVARLAGSAFWRRSNRYFAPVPVKRVPLFTHEVLGRERLEELARTLYDGQGGSGGGHPHRGALHVRQAATAITRSACNCRSPPRARSGLFKKGDELVVEIGTLRRHIGLPTSMAALSPSRAKLENKILTVEMKES